MKEQDRRLVQRWCDGDLDGGERAAFEQRLADDPALRAEVALHGHVAASLKRAFAPPELGVPLPVGPAAQVGPRRWPWFVAGAACAAVAMLVWLRPWSDHDRTELMRAAVGRSWLAACGPPDAVALEPTCASPGQVPDYVQPLAPELPSPLVWRDRDGVRFERGVEAAPQAGLRILELAVQPQTAVFVFLVPAASDPHPVLPRGSGWRLFRRSYGSLVGYELTTLERPRGLACLAARE